MVALLAAGVLVFWLALSTNYATAAQTAADAAALAAEKEVVAQMQQAPLLINGQYVQPPMNWAAVNQAAERYAEANGATLDEPVQSVPEPTGYDVIVLVHTVRGLPAGSVDAAKQAHAEARASTDPLSQSSPATPIVSDASLSSGARFVGPRPGTYGFFPGPKFDYTVGDESEIAGRLDQLGRKNETKFVGLVGYRSPTSSTDTSLHACGAVATVKVVLGPEPTDQQLSAAGLERLVGAKPGAPEEIALSGTTRTACTQGTAPAQPVAGNPNVHLVPVRNGGPQESLLAWPGLGGPGALGGPWVIPTPIVMCESGGINRPPNSAGASGYYQIIPSTWALFGGTAYAPAAWRAPKSIQDLIAARIWNGGAGWANWDCAKMVQWA
jgi:hypothetical protein